MLKMERSAAIPYMLVLLMACIQMSHEFSVRQILFEQGPAKPKPNPNFHHYAALITGATVLKPSERVYCCSKTQYELHREYPVIYCYRAAEKTLDNVWMTSEVAITLSPDEYELYWGHDEVDVVNHFISEQSFLNFNFLFWKPKQIKLNPFNDTCFGIVTSHDYNLQLNVDKITLLSQWLFLGGLALFYLARTMAPDPIFYYITGITVGVMLSLLLLTYYLIVLLPLKKPAIMSLLLGGSGMMLYLMEWILNTLASFAVKYQMYVTGYIATSAAVSFFILYRHGPVTNPQSIDIITWILEAAGVGMMWMSSHHKMAIQIVIAIIVFFYYVPIVQISYRLISVGTRACIWILSLFIKVMTIIIRDWIIYPAIQWCRDFGQSVNRVVLVWRNELEEPQPPRFLTRQEYRLQGRVETEKAVADLYNAFHSNQFDPYDALSRLSPESRDKTIFFLAKHENHITERERVQHIQTFDVELTDDEEDN